MRPLSAILGHDWRSPVRNAIDAVNFLIQGRGGLAGSATITANQTTTTVSVPGLLSGAFIQLTPTSATAAAEAASTYVSSTAADEFVITHPNAAGTGRTWNWQAQRP